MLTIERVKDGWVVRHVESQLTYTYDTPAETLLIVYPGVDPTWQVGDRVQVIRRGEEPGGTNP